VSEPVEDVHALEPDAFRERVHTFQFWFEAVQGYLDGLDFGHRPETEEVGTSDADRDQLVTVLCNYCVGEMTALEGAGGLIQIAPNHASKIFLSTQTVDEGRHLEVFVHRLRELGVADPGPEIARRASPSLVEFRRRLLEYVRGRDWVAALFAQNVILESMEFATFHLHAQQADPRTREVLEGVIKDERRHLGFGENELGRRIREAPATRARLADVRTELDHLVLQCFDETLQEIQAPRDERDQLGRQYLQAVERLGFA
jgi:1,2-phenylacetyl-CoA epoxidase catalytic subunit